MPPSPIDVASAFVAAINKEDLGQLRDSMTDDHTFTDALGRTYSGAAKMIEGWRLFFDAFPQYWIRVSTALAHGSRVALFGEAGGKWKVDERVLPQTWSVTAAWLAEVEGNKVKKWSVFCDTSWATPPSPAGTPPKK
ncbi:MAG: nuclear transport factor 2 family protein [Acidobacteriaceae bacterium]